MCEPGEPEGIHQGGLAEWASSGVLLRMLLSDIYEHWVHLGVVGRSWDPGVCFQYTDHVVAACLCWHKAVLLECLLPCVMVIEGRGNERMNEWNE